MFASTAPESLSESHRRPYETVAAPDQVPLYDLVPVKGPEGEPLAAYRGVRRRDTSEIVSVVSTRYQLVQHREVAAAVHVIGEALERPVADPDAPAFPREVIRLFSGGRRMEVRLVVGTCYELGPGEAVYPGIRVVNSLDGSRAVRAEGTGVRIACANQLYAGMNTLVELREVHLASATDLLATLQKAIHAILGRFGDALRVYGAGMREEMLAEDVGPELAGRWLWEGMPNAGDGDSPEERLGRRTSSDSGSTSSHRRGEGNRRNGSSHNPGSVKGSLRPGIEHEFRYRVPPSKTVPALLPESPEFRSMPEVLATGYLVGLVEWTCVQAVLPHLDWPREQTVGTRIDLTHSAATPPGVEIRIQAKLAEVDGRRLVFQIGVNDELDRVSEGRHERFVIDAEKFSAKAREKGRVAAAARVPG